MKKLKIFIACDTNKISKVKNPELLKKKCTDGVFEIKGNTVKLNQDKVYESYLLEYYADLDQGISLEQSDNIVFTLESWGQLSPKEMLTKSAEILIEKADEMEKLI